MSFDSAVGATLPGLSEVSAASWMLAVAPIVLLVALVLRSRWSTGVNALITVAATLAIGAVAFGAGLTVLVVAVGKGIWTGLWILYVVWPALLLYLVAARAGLDRMGDVLSSILPSRVENVLLLAWVFPSFVQGVAGFGTPIAVAAPLLVSLGLRPSRAVVLPLVGYHWSVTFGSMGSSFYMGALTARLDADGIATYAAEAALILGVNMLLGGVLVVLLYGGWRSLRHAWPTLLLAGSAMFLVLNVAARVEPSIASLSAGAAGLLAVGLRRLLARAPGTTAVARDESGDEARSTTPARPHGTSMRTWLVAVPYVLLLVGVLAVFVPPRLRTFADTALQVGPSFPATRTAEGIHNPADALYTPIGLLEHPGSYILASCLVGLLIYRATGLWPSGSLGPTLRTWLSKSLKSSISVLALATLATVMVDTGMVRTIASGAAHVAGGLFPLLSPAIGALGSFTTGSSTTSNALFAALQANVATLIGTEPAHLVATQTTGSNVGNSLAPVVVLIGASAVGARNAEANIIRQVWWPAVVLLAAVTVSASVLASV